MIREIPKSLAFEKVSLPRIQYTRSPFHQVTANHKLVSRPYVSFRVSNRALVCHDPDRTDPSWRAGKNFDCVEYRLAALSKEFDMYFAVFRRANVLEYAHL